MEGTRSVRLPFRENLPGQGLMLLTMALLAFGAVMVYSASSHFRSDIPWYARRDIRQVVFAVAGLLILLALWRIDYHWLIRRPFPASRRWRWVPSPAVCLFILSFLLAGLVLVAGRQIGQANVRRDFRWGALGFQPAEALKFAVLILLAGFLARRSPEVRSFHKTFLPVLAIMLVTCGVIVTQDFDTAVIIGAAVVMLVLLAGVPWWYLLTLVPFFCLSVYVLIVKDPYRWARIVAFLNPWDQSNPHTYQSLQSMIWIGSGAQPAGLGGGVAKYGYLPESGTDFIFSVIAEEMGIPGVVLVVGLFLLWLWLVRRAAGRAGDRFGALLAGALGFALVIQAALHLLVAVVLAPATGTGLPFISAGGSSLLMMSAATALIVSVTSRRPAGELSAGELPAAGPVLSTQSAE